jgi:hypothetical protein
MLEGVVVRDEPDLVNRQDGVQIIAPRRPMDVNIAQGRPSVSGIPVRDELVDQEDIGLFNGRDASVFHHQEQSILERIKQPFDAPFSLWGVNDSQLAPLEPVLWICVSTGLSACPGGLLTTKWRLSIKWLALSV